ncbi:MAG: antibiotic ABC transporter permease [Desulfuromonas sp.]|nr:MAG: antibiotic ABC transporter permease [Desulfuromonas sp.]
MQVIRRILALIGKELKMIMSDPKSRFVVIGPPLIQFFLFGYAATFDVSEVRYAVCDQARTVESRELLAHFSGTDNFRLVTTLDGVQQIDATIDNGNARMIILIPNDFSERLLGGEETTIQVIVDGRNSNVAAIAQGYVGEIVNRFNRDRLASGSAPAGAVTLDLEQRAWFNANLLSRWFVVAPLGGTICMVVVIILTSLSVAREREFGTFDQLLVAPFTPGEILLAKSVPGILFGLIDSLLLAVASVWWFGVPFRGSSVALVLVLSLFMISIVGIGLLISSLSMTMQQALLGSFIFIMPAVILSGFISPIENMPQWLQTGTLINPLRYVVLALRRIFLEGAGFDLVWPLMWPLMLIAMVTLPPAAWLFRHRAG